MNGDRKRWVHVSSSGDDGTILIDSDGNAWAFGGGQAFRLPSPDDLMSAESGGSEPVLKVVTMRVSES